MSGLFESMAKTYDPEPIEDKWYDRWMGSGLFQAPADGGGEPFSIVIPPPNVTGSLHMGHAFNHTFQDIMCRYKRMNGFNVLWLPGTDHAGIATQNVVERRLAGEGKSRHDIGREEFIRRVWEWKDEFGGRITEQMKRLGDSCDWERERFTLDEGLSRAVRSVFVRLYKKGLIYRGRYIVNWCSRCHTALSDIEVEHEEQEGRLYYVAYPLEDGSGDVVVATTRPETIWGDVAIAVHPKSEKGDLVGKRVRVPLGGRLAPIIEDAMVDPEFGTGCVKITPAHDPNDYLVGQRHDLEQVQVIDEHGLMNSLAPGYEGLNVEQAREKAVEDLKASGALVRVEQIQHSVGHCYRCATTVEPYLSDQWFVRAKPLAEAGVKAVKEEKIRFFPDQWEKVYYQWMENIRDWCVSRQLWWGHRIPAWTCEECGHITVSEEDPSACEKCGCKNLVQDEDVLDTWFSSALWPFSTLGWPDDTRDLSTFYPTSLLVTAFDIIFFWVARMIMMGMEFMDEVPFRDVYIHALIRDEKGRKMSKSSGNVIDPLVMIEKYGADALRMTLAALTVQGRDILLSTGKIETYRLFMNKIWNASRFALMNMQDLPDGEPMPSASELVLHDRWILTRSAGVTTEVTRLLDSYNIGEAARMLYDYVWGDLCDWYLELSKPALKGAEGTARRKATQVVLSTVFKDALRLLHPFIPFVTEELWTVFGFDEGMGDSGLVERCGWPSDSGTVFPDSLERMSAFQEIVRSLRNLRAEAGMTPQSMANRAVVQSGAGLVASVVEETAQAMQDLSRIREISLLPPAAEKPAGVLSTQIDGGEVSLVVGDLIDIDSEIERLSAEIAPLAKNLDASRGKLANSDFLNRAPAEVVEKERSRLAEGEARLRRIHENIESLRRH
ncbi:MAG: valine--tRNA ligase [Synergistota bacterium]|nr:valine--tRNA ligase [Synergistota bacterium]OPZ40241.1 MAG: Valine--tRNA ligase [Synergistetes bacterium ADurb.BinA166]